MINVAVPLLSEFYQAPKPETFNHAWSLLVPKGNQFPVINVVGTNGKGTVTNVLGAYCQKKFKKVGIFQSPVLNHHNNRIKINNHAISDAKIWCYYYRYYQV